MGLSSASPSRALDLSLFDTSTKEWRLSNTSFVNEGGNKGKVDGFVVWQNFD